MAKGNKNYIFRAKGNYPFPLDMLRYDRCSPYNQEDVVAMSTALDLRTRGPVEVQLVSSLRAPTEGRWRSFGWTVSDVRVVG